MRSPAATPFLLALLIGVSLAPALAGGDDTGPPAGGRFSLFAGGREAGYSECRVEVTGGSLVVEERARLSRDDREQDLTLRLGIDGANGRLLSFWATGTQGGVSRVATLSAEQGGLRGEIREGDAARQVELAGPDGAAVLAEPFTAPWVLLAARYDRARGGAQSFPAIYPLEGLAGEVVLSLRGEEAIEIDGRAFLATHLVGEPDRAEPVNLWVAEDGRLLVAARSVAGLSAVRGATARMGLRDGEDPPDPEGVASVRVRFSGPGFPFSGTVMKPAAGGDGPFPAVLLVSGSGPQDRNGNAPGTELQWNHLHALAVALARAGVASLRYDERGVGGSGGSFSDASFRDLCTDARSALDYLASRDDVLPERVGVLGHSEGGLIAAVLAADGPVAAVALLGAPAQPLDRLLLWQVENRLALRGTPEGEAKRILGRMRAFFEHVRLSTGPVVRWEGRVREAAWLREHLDLDLPMLYGRVTCPVLVLHGDRDLQVPAGDAAVVAGSLRSAASVKEVVTPGADHFLMPSGREGLADYAETRRELDGTALGLLSEYFRATLR
jgi:pimeloyl-ACP methyl ester carboxylesterase